MVQAVLADGPYPAFGERVRSRRPHRRADGLGADRSEDRVKAGHELRVAVSYEEAEATVTLFERGGKIASDLGGPRPGRVGSHAEDVHDAALDLDHEEHVVTTEQHAVDAEEVSCQDDLGLGVEELRPARALAPRSRPERVPAQDRGDARLRNGHAELL